MSLPSLRCVRNATMINATPTAVLSGVAAMVGSDSAISMERPLLAQSGHFASEPEAVALDCALRFESPPNSRPSMVCLCRASCFCLLLSSYRYCRPSRRLRRLITGRRHAGMATASCRTIAPDGCAAMPRPQQMACAAKVRSGLNNDNRRGISPVARCAARRTHSFLSDADWA